ncbi:sigma-70 family RNA polymerase sigma factor [Segatella baroniae B14]|nr:MULTISPECIES: sigma-70 family RNA polymerase sigma factor [Segatella]UKK79114.1 sigma-70 family RNA polymerase sigma factor [Segatella baroniae B14]
MDESSILKNLRDPSTVRVGFPMLVKQFSQSLYWKIRQIVLSHDDADDVLQNTFIKVWNNLDQFEGKSSLSTWLYRIAINESLDFLRKKKQELDIDIDADVSVANRLLADDFFDGDEMQALLQEAISRLPEKQRVVFNMKYYDGMKYSDMSKILGTTEGALKASYHIAVQKITEFLKAHH